MVRDMKCWNGAPGEELLRHAWVVDLVYHNIEAIDLCECVHLELTTPFGVASDPGYVVINVLVVLNKELVQLLILFDILSADVPELCMEIFGTSELITQCTEHAIAICLNLFDLKVIALELVPKLDHVDFVFARVHHSTLSLHLPLGTTIIAFFLLLFLIEVFTLLLLLLLLLLFLFAHFLHSVNQFY